MSKCYICSQALPHSWQHGSRDAWNYGLDQRDGQLKPVHDVCNRGLRTILSSWEKFKQERDGAAEARQAHNLEVGGANPSPASTDTEAA